MTRDEELELFVKARYPNVAFDRRGLLWHARYELANLRSVAGYLYFHRCTPHILREFIARHWNDAISSDEQFIVQFCADVVKAIEALPSRECNDALYCLRGDYPPPLKTLRKVCDILRRQYERT